MLEHSTPVQYPAVDSIFAIFCSIEVLLSIYLLIGFSRWGEWMDAQRDQRIFVKGQKNRLHFNKKKQNPVAVVVSADLSSEIEISDLSEQELRR